jgi:3-deoxy-7-phosphoheptulonate synthase
MVDCSHGNSQKDYAGNRSVAAPCAQITTGSYNICGVMLKAICEGRQDHNNGKPLTYGQSITDACISWEATVPS